MKLHSAPWSESIHALFEIPHDNPPGRAFVITAYLDESQQESIDEHVVVAGFCGTEDQWKNFASKWTAAIGNRRLHMKTLRWNRKNAKKTVRELLAKLGPIPHSCGLVPLFASARVSDYYDLIHNESKMSQRIKGYTLCLASIFSITLSRYPGHERIAFVCEQQNKYQSLAESLFRNFQAVGGPGEPYLQSVTFLSKDETRLTQPADFLAFGMAKMLDEPNGKKAVWSRPIFAGHAKASDTSNSAWITTDGRLCGWVMTREQARVTMLDIQQERNRNALSIQEKWHKILSGK